MNIFAAKNLHRWISEYIHTIKFDRNKCPNIFVSKKLIRTNVWKNICDKFIRIFEYIRHTLGQTFQKNSWNSSLIIIKCDDDDDIKRLFAARASEPCGCLWANARLRSVEGFYFHFSLLYFFLLLTMKCTAASLERFLLSLVITFFYLFFNIMNNRTTICCSNFWFQTDANSTGRDQADKLEVTYAKRSSI